MKTTAETIFDKVIKDCFHKTLKPLGFKKRGNNFYLPLSGLGQIINIQKSSYGSKTDISFTINTGIFIPEYFLDIYYYETEIPDFPIEAVCAVRQRIGMLKGEHDKWYEINDGTNEQILLAQMQENLDLFILPYFAKTATRELFIQALATRKLPMTHLGPLHLYIVLKEFEKAKQEYEFVKSTNSNLRILNDAKNLMVRSGLE